ncbi:MAG: GNAT family N-acetyltransferase [Prolixibacteraceae bacterium]
MRKINQEISDKTTIEEILSQSKICRIAMVDEGQAYLLPLNYGYKNNCIYIHSASSGKKLEVLRANPQVCFEIEQQAELVKSEKACNWATIYRSVVGNGKVEILTDFAEKQRALEIIMAHNGAPELIDFETKQVNSIVILKLSIEKLTAKQSGNWEKMHKNAEIKFETDRLSMKEITWTDLENIHGLHLIPEVDEFNTLGIPKSLEETRKLISRDIQAQTENPRTSYCWAINLKDSGKFIGLAGMHVSNDKFRLGEIYYKFHPDYWGNGYATETAKRLIELGFEELKLHKVEAGVAVGNIRSVNVLEKSGMQREGLRRKILPIRGEWVDNYHYAIVEDDPINLPN